MEENPGMAHKIVLNNRDQGNLTGILDVISFDENTIVLDTDMGLQLAEHIDAERLGYG